MREFRTGRVFSGSYQKADIDHAIRYSKHSKFKAINDKNRSKDKKGVDARDWVDASTDNITEDWINEHSDHLICCSRFK